MVGMSVEGRERDRKRERSEALGVWGAFEGI